MGKRFAIVIGVAAAGVMALEAQAAAPAPALASQTVKIDSTVTLAVDCVDPPGPCYADALHGRVESSKHACEVHRTVKAFLVRRRRGPDKPTKLIGKDRSNHHGKWRVVQRYQAKVGDVDQAKVLRSKVRTAGTSFICRGDRSKVVDFH